MTAGPCGTAAGTDIKLGSTDWTFGAILAWTVETMFVCVWEKHFEL